MLFNSYVFIFLYLPITLFVYFFLNKKRLTIAASSWMLFSSLFFYSYWDLNYLPLILGSILFNYTIGSLIVEADQMKKSAFSKKAIFVFGLAGNIVLLSYFKYMDFFIGNINLMLGTEIELLKIVLPLGISFFTITQIAFLVDAYEGLVEEKKLLNYALFVTFFPHLLAGPILHHAEMMPQFDRPRNRVLNYKNLSLGLFLFVIGLSKKVIIADELSGFVKIAFDQSQALSFADAWVASLGYTLQLYFDFSGYSDMAIGLGWMFNITLPVNFNSPYQATNIIDFWKRWHMTLTHFITTYVYTPILRGIGKITFAKSLVAVFLAMFISGVWHGAGWTFVIWGSLHALALVINHIWKKKKLKMPAWLGWAVTFLFINTTFVFFRAADLETAFRIFRGMAGMNGLPLGEKLEDLLTPVAIALLIALFGRNSMEWVKKFVPNWRYAIVTAVLTAWCLLSLSRVSEFLYFQF